MDRVAKVNSYLKNITHPDQADSPICAHVFLQTVSMELGRNYLEHWKITHLFSIMVLVIKMHFLQSHGNDSFSHVSEIS